MAVSPPAEATPSSGSAPRTDPSAEPRADPWEDPRADPWADPRTRSIWRWQLVLAAVLVTVGLAAALLEPTLLTEAPFTVGLVTIIALTSATLLMPWRRIDARWAALVPLIDLIAVGLFSWSTEDRLVLLWAFPVTWIATYYSLASLFGALGLIGVFLLVDVFAGGLSTSAILRLLIVLLALAFMSITLHIGSQKTRAHRRLLHRQAAQLERTVQRVAAHEARTSAFFDSVDTGLARVDRDGTLLWANGAYRRLYSIADLTSTHPAASVEYDTYRGTAIAATQGTVARAARGDTFVRDAVWLFDTTGAWHALEVTARPTRSAEGEIDGSLITVHDVTSAADAEREKKALTAAMSHELRNPLTAIIGHVEMLLDRTDLPPDVIDKLRVIDGSGERMAALTGSLLAPSTDPGEPARDVIDVPGVVKASVDAYRPAAAFADITLTADIAPGLRAWGDVFRLRQVVDNLVSNAVKYTPRGGVVRVSADEHRDDVEIVVADTGIGMSPDDLDHVFDPYFRSPGARSAGIPGTGLGMGISRDIMRQQGGSLSLHSELGRGTRAVLQVPRPRRDDVAIAGADGEPDREESAR